VTGDTRVLDQARIGIRHVVDRVAGRNGRESRPSARRASRARSRSRAWVKRVRRRPT